MPIAVTEEHESLRRTAERWLETHCPPAEAHAVAEAPEESADRPAVWEKMAAQGWLGLHVPEALGGQGFTLTEVAVVLEELGHALFPGPTLPTLLVSAALARHENTAVRDVLLPGLADGTVTAAVALGAPSLRSVAAADGALSISGSVRPVLGLPTARLVLVPLDRDGGRQWWLLDRDALGEQVTVTVEALPALDRTRPVGTLEIVGHGAVLPPHHQVSMPDAEVRSLALVLAAAESAGIARWCLETASEYAKVRVQFGRPIGQFQAVKHALADMLVAVEQCAAVAWDAAAAWSERRRDDGRERDGTTCTSHASPAPGARRLRARAKQCIQILGGIGFTWEHDAHFYLKRATGRPPAASAATRRSSSRVARPRGRRPRGDSPPTFRAEAEALRAELGAGGGRRSPRPSDRRARELVDAGPASPHWPAPWGRDAGPSSSWSSTRSWPRRASTGRISAWAAWALPTIIAHGTAEQQERWVRPDAARRAASGASSSVSPAPVRTWPR